MPARGKEEAGNKGFSPFKVDLWNFEGEMGQLIPLLQAAQSIYGYIPESAIDHINKMVKIPVSVIYGVITFYSQFRLKPMGKYVIKVCDGTACHVNNAKAIIQSIQDELALGDEETSRDGLFTMQKVACLGCCSLSPVLMINNETYGRLTAQKVVKVLREYRQRATS